MCTHLMGEVVLGIHGQASIALQLFNVVRPLRKRQVGAVWQDCSLLILLDADDVGDGLSLCHCKAETSGWAEC